MGVIAAALCGGTTPSRADVRLEADDDVASEIAESSPVADAHAQFEAVLPPAPSNEESRFGRTLVYSGIDAWRYGGSAYIGGEWSPATQTAFVIRGFAADGIDDFRTGSVAYRSMTARASLLPGLHFQAGKLDMKLFLGADYLLRLPLLPALDLPTQLFGARASADIWWEPAKDWMLSGSISATTIERGISGRLASGWRLASAWVGPEVLATYDIYSTQVRAGAHLSGFQIGMTEWSMAGGYAFDTFGRAGPYGRLGITYRP